jgi:undecaprenyl diphosphate synthase
MGIKELTLYAFSTENWKRPWREVQLLMTILRRYLVRERREIMENNVRFRAIGRIDVLPRRVQNEIRFNEERSKSNTGMIFRLALNYGGRQEIIDAIRRVLPLAENNPDLLNSLSEDSFRQFLYDPEMKDPDLLIRTAGEMRVSNFLLWQISYTELYITKTCWPDFRPEKLLEAIEVYSTRERRFGGLKV